MNVTRIKGYTISFAVFDDAICHGVTMPNFTKSNGEYYTIEDITIEEIPNTKYNNDTAPKGMSASYHHILGKQRKSKKC